MDRRLNHDRADTVAPALVAVRRRARGLWHLRRANRRRTLCGVWDLDPPGETSDEIDADAFLLFDERYCAVCARRYARMRNI